jgi:hypothetical protein
MAKKLKITQSDVPFINSYAIKVWDEFADKTSIELIRLKGLELYLREKNVDLTFEVDLLHDYPRSKYWLYRSLKSRNRK